MTDTSNQAILIAATLDGHGGWTTRDIRPDIPGLPDQGGAFWLHINANHPEAETLLAKSLLLPDAAVAVLLAEEIRPRYTEMGDCALIFLRGITMVPGPEPGDLASLRLWITPQGVISAGRRKSHVGAALKKMFSAGQGPRNVSEMVATILDILNDALEPLLQELDDTLGELEDHDNQEPPPRRRFAEIRREISHYRRHLAPQRDMLLRLSHAERSWLDGPTRWQVQEAFDRTARFIEDLDNLRERTEIVSDDMTNAQGMHLNRNIYVLSMISVIFIPLTFLTGLLGMNVNGIPWADKPWAFMGVVGVSLGITLVQIWLFRRFRWL